MTASGLDHYELARFEGAALAVYIEGYFALLNVAKLIKVMLLDVVLVFALEVEVFKRYKLLYVNDVQSSVTKICFHKLNLLILLHHNNTFF